MPITQLTTSRLLIRRFDPHDVDAVHAYTSNTQVMTYIDDGALSLAQTADFVAKQCHEDAQAFAIVLHDTNQVIGHIIFHPWVAPQTYEIGWVVHPDFQHQGLASEAAAAVLHYAFTSLNAHRVIATCQPENPASYRVMERIGMRREGHFRQCIFRGEHTWWDEYFYALLRSEWEARSW